MNNLSKSLEFAPELTLEDLKEIKIPLDLFEVLPLNFCKTFKILPLRLDPSNRILSFLFVDSQIEAELDKIQKVHQWTRLSGFRVNEHTLNILIDQCEKITEAPKNEMNGLIALVEPNAGLNESLKNLLESQGYTVKTFQDEDKFIASLETLTAPFREENILDITQSRRFVPLQSVVIREDVLESPQDFCERVWVTFPSLKVKFLERQWLQKFLSDSLSSQEKTSTDFDFYVRHEDYYHAALEKVKQGDLFESVELLERVDPDNAYYLKSKIVLGKTFLSKRNYNKANFHFQQAYDFWCQDPEAIVDDTTLKLFYHLAYSFEKLSRFDDALKLYERIAGESPSFKEVALRMARVKEKQRKVNSANEKKVGLPAFSRGAKNKESRYEKIEEIGRGGMGIVYRARDRVLGREIALKILSSHFKHDEKIVATFLREAKSLAALNHLHIVTIFDAGIEEGNYYISMEFIEGQTIRELLKKKGYFRYSTAFILSKQVLKALAYAHSKRVIHRDITTNNVMLTETKIVKLMDFGLARVVNQLHSEQSIIGGTPYFMSPEQVEGAPIDHRTDIYSFGVCLYEMLTGQVPFPMENPGYHHLHTAAPDPRKIKPDLPEMVCDVILKCLQKKPADRFDSAEQVLNALKSAPTEMEATLVAKPRRMKKP